MKNIKLNELILQYKKQKEPKILEEIFKILSPTITEKAKYVFYEHTFEYGNSNFRLVDTKQIELKDVIQQLNLEILEWIKKCKITKPFENYFLASKWNWQPKFINANFLKNLNTQSIYQDNEEEEEENLADKILTPEPINIEFKYPLTEIEQEVWDLKQRDLHLSQKEIAEELGISQQTVSNVIASIKKKIQK